MLTTEQINDLHRLYWSEHWPFRKIERHLNMGWKTIRKYLDAPAQSPVHRERPSKLDPFKSAVAEWLEKDPGVSAAVIEQKLRAGGYQGGHSILREYVRNLRPHIAPKRAFVRMEPLAGERFEVDWSHFGSLSYSGDTRKLYAFALVDAHSWSHIEPVISSSSSSGADRYTRTSGRASIEAWSTGPWGSWPPSMMVSWSRPMTWPRPRASRRSSSSTF